MLQRFESEAQIQLSEAHTQAGYHRRDVYKIAELGWLVLYLLPEGGKCGAAIHLRQQSTLS